MRSFPLRRKHDLDRRDTPGLRAFIIEDDPTYSAYVALLARRFGFAVTTARDGTEALEIARTGASARLELTEKLNAARRLVSRQRRMDATVRMLYGLATRDELTGVFNRRYFFAEAERLLAEQARVDLVFIDLDNFKVINDTWGHLAGDRILRDVGEVLARTTPMTM